MKLQGFIKSFGEPRQWKTQNGEARESYPIVISIPFLNPRGEERSDDIITEHVCGNPEYIQRLKQQAMEGKRMEFEVGFSINEWEGKQYQRAKLFNVSVLI